MMAKRLIPAILFLFVGLVHHCLAGDPTLGGLVRRVPLAQFEVVAGRIMAPQVPRAASRNFSGDNREIKESLAVNPSSDEPSISYRFEAADRAFTVEYRSPSSFALSDRSAGEFVNFVQEGIGPLRLSIKSAGASKQEFQAKSLWHLLVFHPEAASCLVPRLECLRMGWQLEEQAAEVKKVLHVGPPSDWLMDRVGWSRCIESLGSPDFQVRQLADQRLRSGGVGAAAYLQTVDSSRLEPEQLRRIGSIMEAATQEVDVPTAVALSWVYDTEVWCRLLREDSLESRVKAADHLVALLGRPLRFDPAAESPVRAAQAKAIEEMLRR